jgi:hypothetical protein
MSQKIPERLPDELLPGPGASADLDDPQVLEMRIRRLVRAGEPTLERYRAGQIGWWQALSFYWQPVTAAALAGTAALVITLGFASAPHNVPATRDIALVAAASDGNPVALWAAAGQQADPVLALIALEKEAP